MARNPIEIALTVARIAVEDATQQLAKALAAEQEACVAVTRASEAIRRETDVATDLTGGDATVEAFAAWLPRGVTELRNSHSARDAAERVTLQARAGLTAARTAEAAVEALLRARALQRKANSDRETQELAIESAIALKQQDERSP